MAFRFTLPSIKIHDNGRPADARFLDFTEAFVRALHALFLLQFPALPVFPISFIYLCLLQTTIIWFIPLLLSFLFRDRECLWLHSEQQSTPAQIIRVYNALVSLIFPIKTESSRDLKIRRDGEVFLSALERERELTPKTIVNRFLTSLSNSVQ